MIGLDTNIVVRFLMQDGDTQFTAAKRVISENRTFIPITVALEIEWVLRSRYKLRPQDVVAAFTGLLGLPMMTFEQQNRVLEALALMSHGADFADALHAAGSTQCSSFATFDAALVRAAHRHGLQNITALAVP